MRAGAALPPVPGSPPTGAGELGAGSRVGDDAAEGCGLSAE